MKKSTTLGSMYPYLQKLFFLIIVLQVGQSIYLRAQTVTGTATYVATAVAFSGAWPNGGTMTVTYTTDPGLKTGTLPTSNGDPDYPTSFTIPFTVSDVIPIPDAVGNTDLIFTGKGTTGNGTNVLSRVRAELKIDWGGQPTSGTSSGGNYTVVKNKGYDDLAVPNSGFPANVTTIYDPTITGAFPNPTSTPAYIAPNTATSTTGNFVTTSEYAVTSGARPTLSNSIFSYVTTTYWYTSNTGSGSTSPAGTVKTDFARNPAFDRIVQSTTGGNVSGDNVTHTAEQEFAVSSQSGGGVGGGFFGITNAVFFNDIVIKYTGVVLPIKLSSFTAQKINTHQANILWSTSSEQGLKNFTVQRSSDNVNWTDIGTVDSKADNGNSAQMLHYSFIDNNPSNGTNYYRLQQNYFIQNTEYSSIINLNFSNLVSIILSPNPVKNNLKISNLENGNNSISIFDASGTQVFTLNTVENIVNINTSNFKTGVYFVKIQNLNSKNISNNKILVQ